LLREERGRRDFQRSIVSLLKLADNERFGEFKGMDGCFSGHSGEIIKKCIQRLPALQIVQQSLKRYARTSKDGRPSKNFWIFD
jgi:hypothetical protein